MPSGPKKRRAASRKKKQLETKISTINSPTPSEVTSEISSSPVDDGGKNKVGDEFTELGSKNLMDSLAVVDGNSSVAQTESKIVSGDSVNEVENAESFDKTEENAVEMFDEGSVNENVKGLPQEPFDDDGNFGNPEANSSNEVVSEDYVDGNEKGSLEEPFYDAIEVVSEDHPKEEELVDDVDSIVKPDEDANEIVSEDCVKENEFEENEKAVSLAVVNVDESESSLVVEGEKIAENSVEVYTAESNLNPVLESVVEGNVDAKIKYFGCPLHCDSGCAFYQIMKSEIDVEKNWSFREQIGEFKKKVEDELQVNGKMAAILQKVLEDISSIQASIE